jgi:hypothetical protein
MSKMKAKWILLDANTIQDNGSGAIQVKLATGEGLEATVNGIRVKAGEITNDMLAGSIAFSKLADADNIARLDQAETIAGLWNYTTAPTINSKEIATQEYVDSVAQGLDPKDSVRAVSIANETLTGLPTTVDGVGSWTAGQRILLTGQSSATENGIWEVQVGAWTRPADFATGSSVAGAYCFVEEGTSYADSGWVCTSDQGSDIVDTDPLAFTQFSGAGQITAGSGLTKSGNTLNVGDANKGIQVNADDLELDASEVAGAGLVQNGTSSFILDIGQGNGVTVNADDIAVDPSQLIRGGNAEIDGDKIDIDYTPSNYTPSTTPPEVDNADELTAHLAGIDQAIAGVSTEEAVKEMHLVTAGEVTAGYFSLSQTPVSAGIVSVTPVGGPQQVNKQIVGATGVTADFDVLNTTELHINNNGSATLLSEEIEEGDVLIIEYVK